MTLNGLKLLGVAAWVLLLWGVIYPALAKRGAAVARQSPAELASHSRR